MSLPTQPYTSIWARGRAAFRYALSLPVGLKTFLGQVARAVAMNIWALQKSVEDLDLEIVPSAQTTNSTLSAWAVLLGLPNGAGGYGLLVPTAATGGVGSLTGALGTVYPLNAIALGPDGTTQIQLTASVTIAGNPPGLGSVSGQFTAVTAGSVGNLPTGSICTWQSAPVGSDPTFKLTSPLAGGNDVETNAAVFARILSRLQNPPRGGTSGDYKIWSEMVAAITGVYVYPKRSGTGTVDIVIVLSGSGTGRVPSATQQTSAQAFVDQFRPVACDAANVLLPTTNSGHSLRTRVVANGAVNAFDWGADVTWTGTPFTVDLYTPGTPATLRLNTLAPASLKAAITAYIAGTGLQPRLQVLSTGSVINPPVGTSKTVTWSDVGGKTTITLDTLPTLWVAPAGGEAVFTYGPVVATIAAGMLAYVDGLGPSRASGYADAFSSWQDTIAINQLARIAEDAVDAGGLPLITEVIAGGATIDAGTTDVQAGDATPSSPPELLFVSHIAVTP
jgi:hypothetical protein